LYFKYTKLFGEIHLFRLSILEWRHINGEGLPVLNLILENVRIITVYFLTKCNWCYFKLWKKL